MKNVSSLWQEEEKEGVEGSPDLVCLNVGGKKFFAVRKNFQRFPATRLGRLVSFSRTPRLTRGPGPPAAVGRTCEIAAADGISTRGLPGFRNTTLRNEGLSESTGFPGRGHYEEFWGPQRPS